MSDIKQALRDFVATSNSGKYKTEDEVLSKFPELQGYDKQALRDFVATSNSGKYATEDEVFAKFPEFNVDALKKKEPSLQDSEVPVERSTTNLQETVDTEPVKPPSWADKFIKQASPEQVKQAKETLGVKEQPAYMDKLGQDFFERRGLDYTKVKDDERIYNKLIAEREKIKSEAKDVPAPMTESLSGASQPTRTVKEYTAEQIKRLNFIESEIERVGGEFAATREARKEFDFLLEEKSSENKKMAVQMAEIANNKAKGYNDYSEKTWGVPVVELVNVQPKSPEDAAAINAVINKYVQAYSVVKAAKVKADVSDAFYNTKQNKQLTKELESGILGMGTSFDQGWKRGNAGVVLAQYLVDGIGPDDTAKEAAVKLAAANLKAQGVQGTYENATWENAVGDITDPEKLDILFSPDGMSFALNQIASSFGQMLPFGARIIPATVAAGGIAGTAAGASFGLPGMAVGAKGGMAMGLKAGAVISEFAVEYTSSFIQSIEESGYDTTDPEQVLAAFNDPDVMSKANEIGFKRGVPVTAMNLISQNIAGKVFGTTSRLASKGSTISRNLAERIVFDPLMEGAGEFAAQVTAGQGVSFEDVVLEAMSGPFQAAPGAIVNMTEKIVRNNVQSVASDLSRVEYVADTDESVEKMSSWADKQFRNKKITAEQNEVIQQTVGAKRTAQDLLDVTGSTSKPALERLMALELAQKKLSSSEARKTVFAPQLSAIKEEIRVISETGKLAPVEVQVNLGSVTDMANKSETETTTSEKPKPQPISERQQQDRDAVLVELQAAREKIGIPIDEVFFDDIADETFTTVDKLDANEQITWAEAERAVEDLYRKYKQLTDMKSDENRMFTLEQIQSMQNEIGNDIQNLTTYIENEGQKPKVSAQENVQGEIVIEPITQTETTQEVVAPAEEVTQSGIETAQETEIVPEKVQDPLKDVESTAKVLTDTDVDVIETEVKLFPVGEKTKQQQISEAYHAAKKDGSNPALVESVEKLLGGQSVVAETPVESKPKPTPKAKPAKPKAEAKPTPEPKKETEKVVEEGEKPKKSISDTLREIAVKKREANKDISKQGGFLSDADILEMLADAYDKLNDIAKAVKSVMAKLTAPEDIETLKRVVDENDELADGREVVKERIKKAESKSLVDKLITGAQRIASKPKTGQYAKRAKSKGIELDDYISYEQALIDPVAQEIFDGLDVSEYDTWMDEKEVLAKILLTENPDAPAIWMGVASKIANYYTVAGNRKKEKETLDKKSKIGTAYGKGISSMSAAATKEELANAIAEMDNARKDFLDQVIAGEMTVEEAIKQLAEIAKLTKKQVSEIVGEPAPKRATHPGSRKEAIAKKRKDIVSRINAKISLSSGGMFQAIPEILELVAVEIEAGAYNIEVVKNRVWNTLKSVFPGQKAELDKIIDERNVTILANIESAKATIVADKIAAFGRLLSEGLPTDPKQKQSKEAKLRALAGQIESVTETTAFSELIDDYVGITNEQKQQKQRERQIAAFGRLLSKKIPTDNEKTTRDQKLKELAEKLDGGKGVFTDLANEASQIEQADAKKAKTKQAINDLTKMMSEAVSEKQKTDRKASMLEKAKALDKELGGTSFTDVVNEYFAVKADEKATKKAVAEDLAKRKRLAQMMSQPIPKAKVDRSTKEEKMRQVAAELDAQEGVDTYTKQVDAYFASLQSPGVAAYSDAAKIAKALDGDYTDPDTVRKKALKAISDAILNSDPDYVTAKSRGERVSAKDRLKAILSDKANVEPLIRKALEIATARIMSGKLSDTQKQAVINQIEDMVSGLLELPVNKSQQRAAAGALSDKDLQAEVKRIAEEHYTNPSGEIKSYAQKLVEQLDIDPTYAQALQEKVEDKVREAVDKKIKDNKEKTDKLIEALGAKSKSVQSIISRAISKGYVADMQFQDEMLTAIGYRGLSAEKIAKMQNLLVRMKALKKDEELYTDLYKMVQDIAIEADETTAALVGKWAVSSFYINSLSNAPKTAMTNSFFGALSSSLLELGRSLAENPKQTIKGIQYARFIRKMGATPGRKTIMDKFRNVNKPFGEVLPMEKQTEKTNDIVTRVTEKTFAQIKKDIDNAPKGRKAYFAAQAITKGLSHIMFQGRLRFGKKYIPSISQISTWMMAAQDFIQGAWMEDMHTYIQAGKHIEFMNQMLPEGERLSPNKIPEKVKEMLSYSVEEIDALRKETLKEAKERVDKGESISQGWYERTLRKKIKEKLPKEVADEAAHLKTKALLLHKAESRLGSKIVELNQRYTRIGNQDDWVKAGAKVTASMIFGFARMTTVMAEAAYMMVPILPIITKKVSGSYRFIDNQRTHIPATAQDITARAIWNVVGTSVSAALFMMTFDLDEEEDEETGEKRWVINLDPDSPVKFFGAGRNPSEWQQMRVEGADPNSMQIFGRNIPFKNMPPQFAVLAGILGEASNNIRFRDSNSDDVVDAELVSEVMTMQILGMEQSAISKGAKDYMRGEFLKGTEKVFLDGYETALSPAWIEAMNTDIRAILGAKREAKDDVIDNIVKDIIYVDLFTEGETMYDEFGQTIYETPTTSVVHALMPEMMWANGKDHVKNSQYIQFAQYQPKRYGKSMDASVWDAKEYDKYKMTDEAKAKISKAIAIETGKGFDEWIAKTEKQTNLIVTDGDKRKTMNGREYINQMSLEDRKERIRKIRSEAIEKVKKNLSEYGIAKKNP